VVICSRGNIDRRYKRINRGGRPDRRRIPDKQSRTHRFLIGQAALNTQAVLSEEEAVITGKYNNGVVDVSGLLDLGEDGTQGNTKWMSCLPSATN
jgi:hypothetical protein